MQKENYSIETNLKIIQGIDNNILKLENEIKVLNQKKQAMIKKVEDLLELDCTDTYTMASGYSIYPDNRHKLELEDIGEFLKWLKSNCETDEILSFFNQALGITELKKFVDCKINEKRMSGEIAPKIGGINIIDVSYRRYKTGFKIKKGKK